MLLLFLVFIPFFFGFLCWKLECFGEWIPRWIALLSMGIVLSIALFLWGTSENLMFATTKGFPKWKIEYLCSWIPSFGINIHFALDGLSLLMIILSGFLGCVAILCSWSEIKSYSGFFHFNLLCILGSVIGVFLSIDMFLFFFFWEIMLIPMYFLISLWGYKEFNKNGRVYAATKFFIYTQISGLIMLVTIIILALNFYKKNNVWSFDYNDLLYCSMSQNLEYLLMLGFFLAFAIKMPIVPFHAWLPDTHEYAPTAGSVDLSGILLKTAAYGFFRFSLPLFPYASKSFAPIGVWLGLLSIFYGAWMAFSQTDIKRLVAYSSISHMGFILIAIYSSNDISYSGAIIQMISHSLSASGMFILCGQLYERLRTKDIRLMGGLWKKINFIPIMSLCFSAAMLGLPGTGNFVGEIVILFGTFQTFPIVVILSVFGIIFASIYSLDLIQRVYYGSSRFLFNQFSNVVSMRERCVVLVLFLCLVLIGFFPQVILNISKISIIDIYQWYMKDI